jgi:hypothetical protein
VGAADRGPHVSSNVAFSVVVFSIVDLEHGAMNAAPSPNQQPIVEFFQLVPNPHPPRRADRSAGGSIPVRALRYCEAMTTASAFGWYVFIPITFKVVWDGHSILWTYDGINEWLPLTRETAQFPNFKDRFDSFAPPDVQGFAPPFLTASFQPGGLQIWTGCLVRTAPGWSLLVRGAANFPKSLSYQVFEGVIETDQWFGPLFDNIRLLKTDIPVEFRNDIPFLQVQPVRKEVYSDKFLQNYAVKGIDELGASDWEAFGRTVVAPNTNPDRKPGRYAVSVRKGARPAVVE